MSEELKINEGDVFAFRYSEAFLAAVEKNTYRGYMSHCFDGQFVARKIGYEIVLVDTYWSDNSSRCFKIDEAKEKGVLTFQFNLSEVEPIKDYETRYYDDADVFNFSHQHGCYKRFMLRKGAQKSKEKMLQSIDGEIADAKSKISFAKSRIDFLQSKRTEIEQDNLETW